MDAGDRAVAGAARECGLDLPGHRLCEGVTHEVPGVRRGIRGDVEGLLGADAGDRASGHVADRVAARLPGRQTDRGEQPHYLRSVGQGNVVELDVLAGGDVTPVQRSVLLDHVPHHVELVRSHSTKRDLDAEHMDVWLPLPVHALPQTEGHEVGRVPLARLKSLDPGFKLLYFGWEVLDDRVGLGHSWDPSWRGDDEVAPRTIPQTEHIVSVIYQCGPFVSIETKPGV